MQHVWGTEVHTGFCWRKLWEADPLEDPGIDGRIILRWNSLKWDEGAWTGFMAQDKESWQSLRNVAMNLLVP